MRLYAKYLSSIALLVIGILSLITSIYTELTIAITLLVLFMVIDKLGKGIVLRESTAMLYVLTCLFMPMIGYMYYSASNPLARLWYKYMTVPETAYFSFALPAVAFFCLTLTWPLNIADSDDEGFALKDIIERIRQVLSSKKNEGLLVMFVGVIAGRLANILPGGLQFFANLFFFSSFAGLLYIYFDRNVKNKKWLMGGFLAFIAYNALASGMFTIVAYMGITIYSFFLIASSPSLFKKTILLFVGIFFIIVLQNTKLAFRQFTWKQSYGGNKITLFGSLFAENLQKGNLFENRAFFTIYSRMNQGYNVALVMRRIPKFQKHDNGVNIVKALASSVVPRFLWPDKPEAGGKFNMKYYTNITLRGWSTNIGPLGEAYGAFGITGGIAYMFVLGAFIRWAYRKVFIYSRVSPLLICWIPVLFYQVTYSGETDTLQIMNSLIKSAFFIWILHKFLPAWFGKDNSGQNVPEMSARSSYS